MGSVNLQASVSPLIPAGTPSPLRISSPQQIRSSKVLPGTLASSLSIDLDNIARTVNSLYTNQQQSPSVNQILLTNAVGQVTAAFGNTTYKGVAYSNFLSELHVGNPLLSNDPSKALFNADNTAVSIGQNGWLDVHDPFSGNAAWIGTQFDTLTISGAANNGAGLIRLQVPGHTLQNGNKATVRNMNIYGVPNAVGTWTVTNVDASHVDLNGSVWAGNFAAPSPLPAGIATYTPTIDRVLQISNITNAAGAFQITTSVAHGYEVGQQVNIPAPGPGAVSATDVQGVVISVTGGAGSTVFNLDPATLPYAAGWISGGTVIAYYAGILAQTIAIGSSFQNYTLRAFTSGALKIKNASITLTSGANSIVLSPTVPSIVLTSAAGSISLNAATSQIVLATAANLARIVLDATVPSITLYDSTGTLSATLAANGSITARSFNGTITLSQLDLTGLPVAPTAPGAGFAFLYYDDVIGALRYNLAGAGWVNISPGGVAAGSPTWIQFNTGGVLDANSSLTWGSATLTVTGAISTAGGIAVGGLLRFNGTQTTGAGTALLGANSPASTLTAPATWVEVLLSGGGTGYVPVWQ